MVSMCNVSPTMPEEWKKKFLDLTWSYRDCFGEDMLSISGAVRHFALHLGRNSAPLKAAKQRNCSQYSKELFNLVIKCYIEANIVKLTSDSALSNAFVVAKGKLPPDTPPMKTLSDLKNPELNSKHLSSAWRLVIDLAQISRSTQDFSSPNITPKEVLSVFTKGKIFLTLDAKDFFSQICLSKDSRYLTAFAIAFAAMQYILARLPQGHAASSAGASLVLKLILYGILRDGYDFTYVDNLAISDYSYENLYKVYEQVLERARYYNLVWKMSDVVIGFRCDDQGESFEVLGLEIQDGRVKVPRRKVESFSPCEFPRNKKALNRLIGNVNYYGSFSSGFAEALFHLREEMNQQTGKKFVFTNNMDKLVRVIFKMIASSNGLLILTKEQYMNNTFMLFCDSSKNSFGASLVCVVGDDLWPICAVSKP